MVLLKWKNLSERLHEDGELEEPMLVGFCVRSGD